MGPIPDNVRRQATHMLSELEPPAAWTRIAGQHSWIILHRYPYAQMVLPYETLREADLDAAIAETRAQVRGHGRDLLIWLVNSDHPWLARALAARGLRNEDTPGFESVENAMALTRPPAGSGGNDVEVAVTTTLEQFTAGARVEMEAFAIPAEGRAEMEAGMAERWEEVRASRGQQILWHAKLAGTVVGTASALVGAAGLNLIGGCVHPDARGRGVYRSLIVARWEAAVARGTPALTVQAGRMSGPVLAQLGFEQIEAMGVYVDHLARA